jgi:hypothetical protein
VILTCMSGTQDFHTNLTGQDIRFREFLFLYLTIMSSHRVSLADLRVEGVRVPATICTSFIIHGFLTY